MINFDIKLKNLGIVLEKTNTPAANYIPYTIVNNLVFISGQLPFKEGQIPTTGIVGDNVDINEAIKIAYKQLGGDWRLPTLKELYSLVCHECKPPKINSKIFPGTDRRAYWTGEKNKMSKGSYWTVNFFTGHKFGRFYPEQEMAVRLVRDR